MIIAHGFRFNGEQYTTNRKHLFSYFQHLVMNYLWTLIEHQLHWIAVNVKDFVHQKNRELLVQLSFFAPSLTLQANIEEFQGLIEHTAWWRFCFQYQVMS